MTEYYKILWGFIFSAIGIILGWILNQLGQWIRIRQEDKREVKVVLYNLLETYFVFTRSDFDKFIKKVIDKFQQRIPTKDQTPELRQIIHDMISGVFDSLLKPELLTEIKIVQDNYQNSITKLASIDPLSAYYLSGKKNIIETFDLIQNIINDLRQKIQNETNSTDFNIQQFISEIRNDMLQNSLIDLEKNIKKIAWKINPYVWFKSQRAIKRLKILTNVKLDKDIDEMMDKLNLVFNNN